MPKFILKEANLIAFVFVKNPGTNFYDVKKYRHNIKDNTRYITKFCSDMKAKFPWAEYINFYYKESGGFKERIYT